MTYAFVLLSFCQRVLNISSSSSEEGLVETKQEGEAEIKHIKVKLCDKL